MEKGETQSQGHVSILEALAKAIHSNDQESS
jgi:hypothetical protein